MKLSVFFFSVLFCLLSAGAWSQNAQDEGVLMEGKKYILHTVQKGESLTALCKMYRVDEKTLLTENPELSGGLGEDMVIRIPMGAKVVAGKQLFVDYEVQSKQTAFSIARRFGITPDILYQYNPSAKTGVKTGQKLRIPVVAGSSEAMAEEPVRKEVPVSYPVPKTPVAEPKATTQSGTKEPVATQPQSQQKSQPVTFADKPVVHRASVYFTHVLQPGETVFDLQKKYGIKRDSLIAINPALGESPLAGTKVKIPADNIPAVFAKPVVETNFIRHKAVGEETIYQVCNKYKVKPGELRRLNPVLYYRDLMAGDYLLIPNKEKLGLAVAEGGEGAVLSTKVDYVWERKPASCRPDKQSQQKIYHVALLVPLYLDANDTISQSQRVASVTVPDSLYAESDSVHFRRPEVVAPKSENFLHFYEGFLLATDSLRRSGMKVEVHVYDTQQNEAAINSILQKDIFREMDLIIGPVFPDLQATVSAFSAKNRIPMVSPLSAAGNYEKTNPYYFKINPSKEFLIEQTARFVADEYFNKNILVMKMDEYSHLPEGQLVDATREGLKLTGYYQQQNVDLFRQYEFSSGKLSGLNASLVPDQENIVIVPASNEGRMSIAVSNLSAASVNAPVRMVGLSTYKRYKSIQPEYFHRTQFTYLSHYFIDYGAPKVNQFISRFRKQFATEPNEFSFQGFDISYYFMSALFNYGKDFPACISGYEKDLLQLNLNLQKVSPTGGFMNQGLYVVEYGKDFSVKNAGVWGSKFLRP